MRAGDILLAITGFYVGMAFVDFLDGALAYVALDLTLAALNHLLFVIVRHHWRGNEPSNTSPIWGKDGARGARLGMHTHSHSANRTVGEATL